MTNKLKHILIVLLSATSLCALAQNNSTAIQPTLNTSLIVNVGISDCKLPAVGFTFAQAAKFGYYASFLIGPDNIHMGYNQHIDSEGVLLGRSNIWTRDIANNALYSEGVLLDGDNKWLLPFYSGKRAYNRLSGTAGFLVRMKIPLYTYIGGGYGYRSETRELLNGTWVQTANSLGHSGVAEAGLVGRIGRFTLQAGYSLFIGQQAHLYHEAKVGIGYTFIKED